jgi:hypothetical protein
MLIMYRPLRGGFAVAPPKEYPRGMSVNHHRCPRASIVETGERDQVAVRDAVSGSDELAEVEMAGISVVARSTDEVMTGLARRLPGLGANWLSVVFSAGSQVARH